MIYRELRRRNIPAEVHVFPGKRHGAHGFERALEFMRQMKFLGALEPEVALTNRYPSVTHDAAQATKIWPAGKMPDAQSKQNEPTIVWHVPTNLTTKAIQIIWSGGAYKGSAPNGFEVEPMRQFLNEKGVTVVVLDYRCPRPDGLAKHTTAWEDAQRAVRLVKAGAKERGLDPNRIGVMGSSAGGHLALMAATTSKTDAYLAVDDFDKISPSVAWAVAIYPAYVLTDGIDGTNKNGGNGEADRFAPEFAFDLATPPVFFIHGDGDGYSSMGSVKAWEQLRRMGIQGELHTLAKRGHCFQRAASPGTGSYNWMEIAWGFIEKLCH